MVSRTLPLALVLAALAVTGVGLALAGVVSTGDADANAAIQQQQVDGCGTIETPGRYVLTGDLNVTGDDACLVVQADNVTVDGDGYAIRGEGPESVGVAVPGEEAPPQNLTVRNVDLDGHGTGVSVEPFRTGDVTLRIRNVRVTGGETGLDLEDASGSVANVTVENNERGMRLGVTDNLTVRNVTVQDNGRGVGLSMGSDATFVAVQISRNDGEGVFTDEQTGTVRFEESLIAQNGGDGIFHQGDDLTVSESVVRANGEAGLDVDFGSARLLDTRLADNADGSLELTRADLRLSNVTLNTRSRENETAEES